MELDPAVIRSEEQGVNHDDDSGQPIQAGPSTSLPRGRRNPTGKNQFPNCPPKSSSNFHELLRQYHKTTTSRQKVAQLLKEEHGIEVSERTISRRWQELGLMGSRLTEETLDEDAIVQLVSEQMSQDPSGKGGPNTIKKQLAKQKGVHLKRETVRRIQTMLDPEAAAARKPIRRRAGLTLAGPNDVWFCHGSNKVPRYELAIWGLRDAYSQKWLGLWVIPNYRIELVVAYLWLKVVREIGGIPSQISTTVSGCGPDQSVVSGLAHALQEASNTHYAVENPLYPFLRNVQSIPIQRDWQVFKPGFEDNFSRAPGAESLYNPSDPTHRHIINWLLPPVVQKDLDKIREATNEQKIPAQKNKKLPSDTTPNIAYTTPENFGGRNCLEPVDLEFVGSLISDLEAEGVPLLDWEVPEEVSQRANEIIGLLNLSLDQVDTSNVWIIFAAIIGLLHRP